MMRKPNHATEQKNHWDRKYGENPAFFGERPSEFAMIASNLFRDEGVQNVLEFGCGQGRDTLLFVEGGLQVTALDYSETALGRLDLATQKLGVSDRLAVQTFDVRKALPFPDSSFDACYSHMLLCMELSTEELTFIVREIYRVLKPDGIALYSVRNTFDKHFETGVHKSEDMYEIGGFVVHFFSEAKIRSLSEGFRLLEIRRMREGTLPRELFGVILRKDDGLSDPVKQNAEANVTDPMGKYQEFFDTVYSGGVLDRKTKFLVALAASLAGGCGS